MVILTELGHGEPRYSLNTGYKAVNHARGNTAAYRFVFRIPHKYEQQQSGVERGSVRRSSLKGRERDTVSQTNIGTVSKATVGKLLRVRIITGFCERIDAILI